MIYVLDTNTCIYSLRGKYPQLVGHFEKRKRSELVICAVTAAELYNGVALLTRQRVFQLQRTQWAMQARLNAHSGFNQFCAEHKAPAATLDFGPSGSCHIELRGQDLWFVGHCHGISRSLLAPSGDVRRIREVNP